MELSQEQSYLRFANWNIKMEPVWFWLQPGPHKSKVWSTASSSHAKKESSNQSGSNNEKPWSDSKGHSDRSNELVGFEIFSTRAALQSSGLYNRVAWKKITLAIKEGNKGLQIVGKKKKTPEGFFKNTKYGGSFGALITMMTDVFSWNSKEPRKRGVFGYPVWHCCH